MIQDQGHRPSKAPQVVVPSEVLPCSEQRQEREKRDDDRLLDIGSSDRIGSDPSQHVGNVCNIGND